MWLITLYYTYKYLIEVVTNKPTYQEPYYVLGTVCANKHLIGVISFASHDNSMQ